MKTLYALTVGARLGPGPSDDKEATVLNRVVRWTSAGLEYWADPKQIERLLEELGLDSAGVKGVVTPGVKTLAHQISTEKESDEQERTRFRALAARANHLAAAAPTAQTYCSLPKRYAD